MAGHTLTKALRDVRFLDLSVSNVHSRRKLLRRIDKVLRHGSLILGPEVAEFEAAMAIRCRRRYAIAVGSGSDALYLSLLALGIGPGDEVITTSLSWIATANAIALTGANPVFCDITTDLNMDPESVSRLVSRRTRAIVAVNYAGKVCRMTELEDIAALHNLYLIEDGSQSFGAKLGDRPCGSFGTISAISHNPMKILAAVGESGTILCDDSAIRDRLVQLRYNGTDEAQICQQSSINGRMDTVQAAVLLSQLEVVDEVVTARRKRAKVYDRVLRDYVTTPDTKPSSFDVYYYYVILTEHRENLRQHLKTAGVETTVKHEVLMPNHPPFATKTRAETTMADRLVNQLLCLPIHQNLPLDDISYVAHQVTLFFQSPSLRQF